MITSSAGKLWFILGITLVIASISVVNAMSISSLVGSAMDKWFHLTEGHHLEDDVTMTAEKYLKHLHYPVERHNITTQDGYILNFFRIQGHKQTIQSGKPVVYLQHGLISSSDAWVFNDEHHAPALVLANHGYDVWLGNSRGNFHSRYHERMNPDKDNNYWDFSWQEMAEYDIPAAFEFIHRNTGRKVNYVGHSQGTLVMFAALALKHPQLLENIGEIVACAPIAFLKNVKEGLIGSFGHVKFLKAFEAMSFSQEIFSKEKVKNPQDLLFCKMMPYLCHFDMFLLTHEDSEFLNKQRIHYISAHSPGGTSKKNLYHFQQMLAHTSNETLKHYDYGRLGNLQRYRNLNAPLFPLEKIQNQKIHLMLGDHDSLSVLKDVENLKAILGENVKSLKVYPQMAHSSFMYGSNMHYLDDLKRILDEAEKKH